MLTDNIVKTSSRQPFVLRAATHQDIPALAQICRESFPGSPRWLLDGGRTWWTKAMAFEPCEIWVAEGPHGLRGFVLFVTDERAWAQHMKSNNWDRARQLIALCVNPKAVAVRLGECGRAKANETPDGQSRRLKPEERLYVELFAVSSRARRSGAGRQLAAFGVRRAAELGLRGICYRVDRKNEPMIALMRSTGCSLVHSDGTGYLFSNLVEGCRDANQ